MNQVAALDIAAPGRSATARPRLAQPAVEFLLTGGGTLLLLPVFWLLRSALGLSDAEFWVSFLAFHLAYVVNDPHFAVTYLLFYRRVRERAFGSSFSRLQRVRYVIAGFVAPTVLVVWLAWALETKSAFAFGCLFQLMFFLVSWHYVKQAFGILLVLSARRGVRFAPLERQLFLAHALFAWFYARATPFDPGMPQIEQGVFYHSFRHPDFLVWATGVPFWISAVGAVWALGSFFQRTRSLPPLAPLLGFFAPVWLWVVYSSWDPLLLYVIPALHSLQYLYMVALERGGAAQAREHSEDFGPTRGAVLGILAFTAIVLGYVLFHGAPEFLDGALVKRSKEAWGDLGPTPYLAAFVAFVNVHHYFMDAAIWRRELPEMQALVNTMASESRPG